MEDLRTYFESTQGLGVLSTADAEGRVNAAIYARPHVLEDGALAFIMAEHRSHEFITRNARAHYLFVEDGEGYRGVRLCLRKIREEDDPEKIEAMRRRGAPCPKQDTGPRHLVIFEITEQRPLVGDG